MEASGCITIGLAIFKELIWAGVKHPLMNFEVSDPEWITLWRYLWTRPKYVVRPAQLQKKIALAFLKVAWPQIPYWMHFTFKV